MKLAVISDIHGNLPALEAVIADIDDRGVDVILNLGDIISGPLFPAETVDKLMALGLPTIRGNHERQLLGPPQRMGPSDRHAAAAIRAEHREWIENLPSALRLGGVLMVHGTPASDLEYFLETVTPDGWRAASDVEVLHRAGPITSAVIVCGHTHVPRSVSLPDGRLIVNPGSVGLQAYHDDLPFPHDIEVGTPHARYALITKAADGWSAEHVAVNYDWSSAAHIAASRGRDDWARALRSGRV